MSTEELKIIPVKGIGEIPPGTDLGRLIADALHAQEITLQQHDVLVVTQKIVSKAEGRTIDLNTIEPSPFATQIAQRYSKDARHVEVVLRESIRIVPMDHAVIISQTHTTEIAVIVSDTWGRPWRNGQVNMAIGSAGIDTLADYRGQIDPYGYELHASIIAVADELASAAELVMGKIDQVPVAIIRGYHFTVGEQDASALIRDSATDMFR